MDGCQKSENEDESTNNRTPKYGDIFWVWVNVFMWAARYNIHQAAEGLRAEDAPV